jgi:hypothetical protein
MRINRRTIPLAVAVACLAVPGGAGAQAPLSVDFQKSATSATTFAGSATGDVAGHLTSAITGVRPSGDSHVLHVDVVWTVDGPDGFTATTSGILDTQKGTVVLNGVVSAGPLAGARVHEEGRMTNPATGSFAGTIRLMPGGDA